MKSLSIILLCARLVFTAQSVDLDSKEEVAKAAQNMAANMITWLDRGLVKEIFGKGDGTGIDAFQWYGFLCFALSPLF